MMCTGKLVGCWFFRRRCSEELLSYQWYASRPSDCVSWWCRWWPVGDRSWARGPSAAGLLQERRRRVPVCAPVNHKFVFFVFFHSFSFHRFVFEFPTHSVRHRCSMDRASVLLFKSFLTLAFCSFFPSIIWIFLLSHVSVHYGRMQSVSVQEKYLACTIGNGTTNDSLPAQENQYCGYLWVIFKIFTP